MKRKIVRRQTYKFVEDTYQVSYVYYDALKNKKVRDMEYHQTIDDVFEILRKRKNGTIEDVSIMPDCLQQFFAFPRGM